MLWETILLALREISRNVLRSSLTILGIVIGVAAVITMVTLGAGATAQVTADIAKLGTNLIDMQPGQSRHGRGSSGDAAPFKIEDAKAVEREVAGILAVAPYVNSAAQAIYANANWATRVVGSTNDFLVARNWELASGRDFTSNELQGGKAVAILGNTVKDKLFGAGDPVGAYLRLGTVSFQVIGVFKAKGVSGFGSDQDDFVFIPLRTMQRRISGNNNVAGIAVSARDTDWIDQVQADMERLMRERRRIQPGKPDDFHVRNTQELVGALTGTTQVLTALLGAVAAVSLLVGGIGIMNIMLVSVTERTREIGTRLAIGALEREVLLQFLVEAVVLTSLGGLAGIALGLGGAYLLAGVMGMPFVFQPGIVALAFVFSAAVGVIFGYFPARKAAQMDPIEALRHE